MISIYNSKPFDMLVKLGFVLKEFPYLLFNSPTDIAVSFLLLFKRGPYKALQSLYDVLVISRNKNSGSAIEYSRAYSHALVDRKNKIIMDFSEKCGCTISIKMFFRHMGILDKALRYNPFIHHYRRQVFSKLDSITRQDLNDPSYFKFKVVRNPYSRAVSSYVQAMRTYHGDKEIMNILMIDHKDISFSQFVDYLSKADLTTCNQHWRLQKKEYEYENSNVFDFIVKLESIVKNINKINKIRGVNFDPRGLTSNHHVKKHRVTENVATRIWSEIRGNIPRYRAFYNNDLIKKVGEVYKDDIEAYDYSYRAENI